MLLPDDFSRETRLIFGEERFGRFAEALDEPSPVSIRLNPMKVASPPQDVPWCPNGRYLSERPNFTFDPLLHAGCYYVQEASSMFIDHVLRQLVGRPVLMLDLCAAPGGKSTAARTALPEGSMLVSNEPIRQRAQVLSENVQKWGWPDCIVTNNYPRDFRKAKTRFDVILCDVPCSGEGMFRKDAQAVAGWSLENVERCSRLQREIVADAWHCLADGGLLIYSTCTYNIKENEQNVQWICEELGGTVESVATKPEWAITGSLLEGFNEPVYRFIPGYTRGEGLFMAVLRKPGEEGGSARKTPCLLAEKQLQTLNILADSRPKAAQKGRNLAPNHAEALAVVPRIAGHSTPNSGHSAAELGYPTADLDYPTAISYLRGEAIQLPTGVERGYVAVTFLGKPLGFVKNIGQRANNLYPKEWRIKSTHIPNDYEAILRLT